MTLVPALGADGEALYDALAAVAALFPQGHPAQTHLTDALAKAILSDYTPVAPSALVLNADGMQPYTDVIGYVLLEPDGTITTYATAALADLQTYVAAL